MEETLTVKEVADVLKLKKRTVYELIRSGMLPASKIGRSYRVSVSDVHVYLEERMLHPRVPKNALFYDTVINFSSNEDGDIIIMLSEPAQYILIEAEHREKLAELIERLDG